MSNKKINCSIKPLKKNERHGSMQECFQMKKVNLYGINKIDPNAIVILDIDARKEKNNEDKQFLREMKQKLDKAKKEYDESIIPEQKIQYGQEFNLLLSIFRDKSDKYNKELLEIQKMEKNPNHHINLKKELKLKSKPLRELNMNKKVKISNKENISNEDKKYNKLIKKKIDEFINWFINIEARNDIIDHDYKNKVKELNKMMTDLEHINYRLTQNISQAKKNSLNEIARDLIDKILLKNEEIKKLENNINKNLVKVDKEIKEKVKVIKQDDNKIEKKIKEIIKEKNNDEDDNNEDNNDDNNDEDNDDEYNEDDDEDDNDNDDGPKIDFNKELEIMKNKSENKKYRHLEKIYKNELSPKKSDTENDLINKTNLLDKLVKLDNFIIHPDSSSYFGKIKNDINVYHNNLYKLSTFDSALFYLKEMIIRAPNDLQNIEDIIKLYEAKFNNLNEDDLDDYGKFKDIQNSLIKYNDMVLKNLTRFQGKLTDFGYEHDN
jgi:hypothetical protein